jgi:hypothetical protein
MTVSRYSVIRYVPDPLREEHVNIGVVVVSEDGSFADCRLLSNWEKARKFGGRDVGFLKDFARDFSIEVDTKPNLFQSQRFTAATLNTYVTEWRNVVQFSEPRASTSSDPRRLLDQLYAQFVTAPPRGRERVRDKRDLVRFAAEQIRAELGRRFAIGGPRLNRSEVLHGKVDFHTLDLVIRNGRPLVGIDALSFEIPATSDLANEIKATAWTIDDLRHSALDLPLDVLMLPPLRPRKDFEHARQMYETLGAQVVLERDVPEWAATTVAALSESGIKG